jgi:serine/threonine protein kinase
MPEDYALASGTQLGHYRITKILGRGGFGITYQAWDDHLNRLVAIKEYFPHGQAVRGADSMSVAIRESDQATYRKGLERFLTEARTLAQFRDPRIVHVHGFQEAFNTAYMVMDFEEGVSLRDHVLQHGTLSSPEARRILVDILRALQVLHLRNYLHRDVKPANIMRRPDGSILLLDFGSARITQNTQDQAFTVVVTPGYAPMEQYTANEAQGPSTDLYAVGACMLFCLTGASPVDAMKRTIAIQSNESDPLEAILSAISERDAGFAEIAGVLRWLLQSQAHLRPQTAGAALQRLGTSMVVPSLPTNSNPEQQTVIFSPPALYTQPAVDLTVMRSIPSKLVEPMRVKLESMVGDRATQILFQSIRSARNAQDLVERIAEQIAYEPRREQAISSITQLLAEASRVITVEAAPIAQPSRRETNSGTRPTQLLKDDDTTQLLSNELAKYIGPIAKMLLKKRLAKATSVQELIAQLEEEIPTESDRAAFRKAVTKLKILPS